MTSDMESAQEVLDSEYMRVEALDRAYDVAEQFKNAGSAINTIVLNARDEAISAMDALVRVDPEQPKLVRELQWRVRRYDDLCRWIKAMIEHGSYAIEDLTAEQSAELEKLIRRGDEAEKDA